MIQWSIVIYNIWLNEQNKWTSELNSEIHNLWLFYKWIIELYDW